MTLSTRQSRQVEFVIVGLFLICASVILGFCILQARHLPGGFTTVIS